METKLRELLDLTYELEGLVHLILKRDVSSADLLRIIVKKGEAIGELATSIKRGDDFQIVEAPEEESFDLEEYTIDDTEEEEFLSQDPDSNPSVPSEDNKTAQKGKLVFSINDRFRYKKELFGNSDADFNNTLALVASMDSYDEAEEYFINEEGFDKNLPLVVEFLDIIKRYFK